MGNSTDEEVTTPEAAQYLNVTPPHIRLLYYRGVLRGEKRGRDLWITKESLEEYQRNRRPAGRPEGSVSSGPSKNKRGERERDYQREYKRKLRKGEILEPSKVKIAGRTGKKARSGKKG
jgi:excisionase family DNA binding protein